MPQGPYDVGLICIGSGPAGQRAAIEASKLGKRVAVIEKQRCIGGVCIESGTIPSKTFREAVRRYYRGKCHPQSFERKFNESSITDSATASCAVFHETRRAR